jgi:hypothetical protein
MNAARDTLEPYCIPLTSLNLTPRYLATGQQHAQQQAQDSDEYAGEEGCPEP